MHITLKIAENAADREAVFRLRRQVLVNEEARFEHQSDMLFDRYDTLEESANIVALAGGEPVGTMRVTMANQLGCPARDQFDFGPTVDALEGGVCAVSWLCIAEAYRSHPGLIFGLFKTLVREMRRSGVRHVVAPLRPSVLRLLRKTGVEEVGAEFHSAELNMSMVPIHIDSAELPPGVRETMLAPLSVVLEDSNERRIYLQDEAVIRKGDDGAEAFLVMRGSVRVAIEGNGSAADDTHSARREVLLGPGQIFGELSMLDGGLRTATVVAHSRETDVMVWSRDEFLSQLRDSRDKAYAICRVLGQRLRAQVEGAGVPAQDALVARILLDASNDGRNPVDFQWLASQCGLWPDELEANLYSWARPGWLLVDAPTEVRVTDAKALSKRMSIS